MTVEEVMTPNPASVDVTCTIGDVIDLLNELDIRHVPVTNNGVLVGMVSDRDLRDFALPAMVKFNSPEKASKRLEATVGAIMHSNVVAVGTQTELSEVAQMMVDDKFGAVPVCDQIEGKLVGIVSYIDVLKAAIDLF